MLVHGPRRLVVAVVATTTVSCHRNVYLQRPAPSLRTVDAEGTVTSVSRPLTRRRGGRVGRHEMTAGADVRLVE